LAVKKVIWSSGDPVMPVRIGPNLAFNSQHLSVETERDRNLPSDRDDRITRSVAERVLTNCSQCRIGDASFVFQMHLSGNSFDPAF
jgi:hypothetical protein